MELLKIKLKEVYKKEGLSELKKEIGSVIKYREYVDLGNSFLPQEDRKKAYLNVPCSHRFGSDFMVDELIKEWENEKV